MEYLARLGAKTLFATHYHQLNDLERQLPGVKNFRVLVKEGKEGIIWLHKIAPGGTDKSYGIQVAKLAGLPESVVQQARWVLSDGERSDTLPNTLHTFSGRGNYNRESDGVTGTLTISFEDPSRTLCPCFFPTEPGTPAWSA